MDKRFYNHSGGSTCVFSVLATGSIISTIKSGTLPTLYFLQKVTEDTKVIKYVGSGTELEFYFYNNRIYVIQGDYCTTEILSTDIHAGASVETIMVKKQYMPTDITRNWEKIVATPLYG